MTILQSCEDDWTSLLLSPRHPSAQKHANYTKLGFYIVA